MPKISYIENIVSIPKLLVSLAFAIVIILMDTVGIFDEVKSVFSIINSNIATDIKSSINSVSEKYYLIKDKSEMRDEIEMKNDEIQKLLSENTILSNKIEELSIIQNQNQFSNDQNLLTARVISSVPDEFGHVLINKGSDNGVVEGGGVVIRNYAVGIVTEVYSKSSKVRLIISPQSKIAGYSEKNNALGVVAGDISNGLRMDEIPVNSIIEDGELILTTGVDENFPKGYILGQVKKIDALNNEATKVAELNILYEPKSLIELFIIME